MKYSFEKQQAKYQLVKWLIGRGWLTIRPFSGITSGITQNGFTLIEIIVVMLLIAISSSLVLMNVGQSGRMNESRMFAGQVVSMCKKARLTAIARGVPACLTISPESRECKIGFMDDELLYSRTIDTADQDADKNFLSHYSATNGGSEEFSNDDLLKIPENILLEGEQIKVDYDGLYLICFYPDGSSGGGILTISVENEFEFTFQVDMLTGSIREIASPHS